jgi:WD40 repeat protein
MVAMPWPGSQQEPEYEDVSGTLRRLLVTFILTVTVFLTAPPAHAADAKQRPRTAARLAAVRSNQEPGAYAWARMPLGEAEFGALTANGRWSVTTESGKLVNVCAVRYGAERRRLENSTAHYLHYARVSPDGSLAVGVGKAAAIVWHVGSGRVVRVIEAEAVPGVDGFRAAVSHDASRVAVLRPGGISEVLNARTGARISTRIAKQGSLFFTDDGNRVVTYASSTSDSASDAPCVEIWDARTGKTTARFELDLDGMDGCSASWGVSPDGSRMAAADSAERRLYLYDAKRGVKPRIVSAPVERTVALSFSPDSKLLVTVREGAVELRDANTGRIQRVLPFSGSSVQHASFSSDGLRIATASADHVIRVWSVRTGQLVRSHRVNAQGGGFRFVGLAPDGSALLGVGEEQESYIWLARPGSSVIASRR